MDGGDWRIRICLRTANGAPPKAPRQEHQAQETPRTEDRAEFRVHIDSDVLPEDALIGLLAAVVHAARDNSDDGSADVTDSAEEPDSAPWTSAQWASAWDEVGRLTSRWTDATVGQRWHINHVGDSQGPGDTEHPDEFVDSEPDDAPQPGGSLPDSVTTVIAWLAGVHEPSATICTVQLQQRAPDARDFYLVVTAPTTSEVLAGLARAFTTVFPPLLWTLTGDSVLTADFLQRAIRTADPAGMLAATELRVAAR